MPDWINWLLPLSLIFGLALIGSLFAKRINKPSIIIYILLGAIAANFLHLPGFSRSAIEPLATFGIVLLLFTIGLQLPIKKLLRAGKYIVIGSALQIILSALVIGITIVIIFQSWSLAFLLAFPLAMSSTAVVSKLLQEQSEDSSLTGEITLGVLIIQDLLAVFLITLFSFIVNADGLNGMHFFLEIFKVVGILIIFYLVFDQLFSYILLKVKLSREEISLFTFALLFFTLWIFSLLHIPETTAGFLLGVLLAERIEQYEIFSQVRVLRDILLVLFFFFLGTYIQSVNLIIILQTGLLALLFLAVKLLINWISFLVLGFHQKTAYWVGFDLMEHGEFAFIILTILSIGGLITPPQYQFFVLVIVWSLLLFSYIYGQKVAVYKSLSRKLYKPLKALNGLIAQVPALSFDQLDYTNHIVLCGYGRVGSYLGHGLLLSKIPLIVIDTDTTQIKKLREKGIKAIYGDATEIDILDYAQVEKAKFLIITVPNPREQEQIIMAVKKMNPKLEIITRSHLSSQLRHLKSIGVYIVFQPEFETALSMLKRILKLYRYNKEEIKKRLHYLKMEHGTE